MPSSTSNTKTISRVLCTHEPPTNEELRVELYKGSVFRLPATKSSLQLIGNVMGLLEQQLGSDPCKAQFKTSVQDVIDAMASVQKLLWTDEYQSLLTRVVEEVGFDPADNPFSGLSKGLRFRANPHMEDPNADHGIPRNYHRDTWFGMSQALINWWIPLHDVTEEETFSFYPDYFHQAVPNSSGDFDLDEWKQKAGKNFGYGDKQKRDMYPKVTDEKFDGGEPLRFSGKAGDIILFSAHMLHRTNFHSVGHTRFSVDFRTVNQHDKQFNIGAPNVDNASRGETGWQYH